MKKSTKIMLSVIGSVLAVCIIITAAASINNHVKLEGESKPTAVPATDSEGNAVPDTTVPEKPLAEQILGCWRDSANMSGYEFFENGKVRVTYVNLVVPFVNLPINGSADGSYTVNGDAVTVRFSIYSGTITKNFTAKVENNTLMLRNKEDGDVATYERSVPSAEVTTENSGAEQPQNLTLHGGWVNSDGTVSYTFFDDGKAKILLSPSDKNKLSGEFDGVYMTSGGTVTIQYSAKGSKVTETYEYTLSDNSMSLKSEKNGMTEIFVKQSNKFTAQKDIIGKWLDGAGMSGYNFKSGGTVDITYVNFTVPVVNMPINGTLAGTYKFDGDKLTISFSVYSKTVKNTYKFSVSGNSLTLTNVDDGSVTSYSRAK